MNYSAHAKRVVSRYIRKRGAIAFDVNYSEHTKRVVSRYIRNKGAIVFDMRLSDFYPWLKTLPSKF